MSSFWRTVLALSAMLATACSSLFAPYRQYDIRFDAPATPVPVIKVPGISLALCTTPIHPETLAGSLSTMASSLTSSAAGLEALKTAYAPGSVVHQERGL
jgi:hypothetical protein